MLHFEFAIFGYWVVQCDDGWNELFDRQNMFAQTLVVVHQIEVVDAVLQSAVGAQAKSQRLGKSSFKKIERFKRIRPVVQFPIGRKSPRVLIVENVETRQPVQLNAGVKHGVGLPAIDLDMVAKIGECFGEMTGVNTLATHVGFAPISKVSEP